MKHMREIIRNRTIRPSTRLEKSKSYKIDTKAVTSGDILVVNINHESKPFRKTFKINGTDVAHKDSISFRVNDFGTHIDISWSGATPIGAIATKAKSSLKNASANNKAKNSTSKPSSHIKTSFSPLCSTDITVLILGTMPGDKSLELGEYYAHSGNRFWKIISTITNNDLPMTYADKGKLLLKTKIGVWDVAHKVSREGSLDSAIEKEERNDLDSFITEHKNLKIIGFNGTKAETLYDKYFDRKGWIKYILLPSTRSANTGIDFANICEQWRQILTK